MSRVANNNRIKNNSVNREINHLITDADTFDERITKNAKLLLDMQLEPPSSPSLAYPLGDASIREDIGVSSEGLVYCSDMKINYGAANPISDTNKTGSRVSDTGLLLSTDMKTLRSGKLKNFADATGATDGTLAGGITVGGVAGVRATGTAFDGVDDKITFPALPSVTSGSIRILWKRPATIQYNEIVADVDARPALYQQTSGNAIKVRFAGATGMPNNGDFSGDIPCAVGIRDVSICWTPTTISVYVDGNLLEYDVGTFPATVMDLILGVYAGTYGESEIYEFMVWNRKLSHTEVRQLYEDSQGWIENLANAHCKDISDTYPLGSDRVSSTGLVLALDMETLNSDGTLKDFSGLGNHATVSGSTYQRGAIKNGSQKFAVSHRLVCSGSEATISPAVTGEMTFFGVIKADSVGTTQRIFGKGASTKFEFIGSIQDTSKLRFTAHTNSGTDIKGFSGTTSLIANKVYIYAFVIRNGQSIKIYLDGVLDGEDLNAWSESIVLSTSPYCPHGRDTATNVAGVSGPHMVFNRALSATEIANLTIDTQKMLGLVKGGTTNLNVAGQVGQAVDFDGSTQYVEVLDCPALNPANITVGLWNNKDQMNSYPTPIGKSGTNTGYYIYGNDSASICGKVGNNVTNANPSISNALVLNTWHFVAMTHDGANAYIYCDGKQSVANAFAFPVYPSTANLRLGLAGTGAFDGRVAFPFIFSRALTATEVENLRKSSRYRVLDKSGNRKHVYCTSDVVPTMTYDFGRRALNFDGTNDKLEGDKTGYFNRKMTLIALVRPEDVEGVILSKASPTDINVKELKLYTINNTIAAGVGNATASDEVTFGLINQNEWVVIVLRIDGDKFDIFCNNKKISDSLGADVAELSSYRLVIGGE